jgi:hypothetical protein
MITVQTEVAPLCKSIRIYSRLHITIISHQSHLILSSLLHHRKRGSGSVNNCWGPVGTMIFGVACWLSFWTNLSKRAALLTIGFIRRGVKYSS